MEELIRYAFLHVAVIGPHVADGHYDLLGPSGEIILPQVWESLVEPHWAVTMHMWPMPELTTALPDKPPAATGPPGGPSGPGFRRREGGAFPPPGGRRGPPPPPPPGWIGPLPDKVLTADARPAPRRRGPPPPPPGWIGPPLGGRTGGNAGPEKLIVVEDGPKFVKSSKKKPSRSRGYGT